LHKNNAFLYAVDISHCLPTGQPRLSAIVQARRLSLFGHIPRMPDRLHGWRLSSKTWDQTISHWMRR